MKLGEAFPSNYVKSSDLQGRTVRVVIASYAMEKLGDEQKLILYFQHKEKGLVLNKTNANEIADSYSDDLDNWIGREIELFVARVDFQGKKVDGLRVRVPQQNGFASAPTGQQQTPNAAPQQQPTGSHQHQQHPAFDPNVPF